jgi:6-pyruvoyltetrahydropterin/6-carboxytetrahydropterin synthase
MYKIKVISNFSAAHSLGDYKGKCENLHGHNWKVEVVVSSNSLDSIGMVIDFGEVKKIVKKALNQLDHKYLNDLDYFQHRNPSSEEIARYIFTSLRGKIFRKKNNLNLEEVRVWETQNACAIYQEEKKG